MTLPLNTTADANDPIVRARFNMIEQQVRPWNVLDEQVLALLEQVRREDFVPPAYRAMAFMDTEIPLFGEPEQAMRLGRCMLPPRVEARMLQDLRPQPGDRVLEVGAGSGYMAALLASCTQQVVSLEIVPELAEFARRNLQRAGIANATVRVADGAHDALPEGPFDIIVLSGSVGEVPARLLDQLRPGGRLGAIVGDEPIMRFTLVRQVENRFEALQPWDCNAPRLLGFPEPVAFEF